MKQGKITEAKPGDNFEDDTTSGNFRVSVFGSMVTGSYRSGQDMPMVIAGAFLIAGSTIESRLRSQLAKG